MGEPARKAPRPRKQQERSARTKRRLLDAAVLCISDRGYANTTVAEICDRAGVSRGAQIHHFPTKGELMAAAIAHHYRQRARAFAERVQAMAATGDVVGAAIDVLWNTTRDDAESAGQELVSAARTDPELREHLVPYLRQQPRLVAATARRIFGDLAEENPAFDDVVWLVMNAITGIRIRHAVDPQPEREARQLAALKAMVRRALASPESLNEPPNTGGA